MLLAVAATKLQAATGLKAQAAEPVDSAHLPATDTSLD
jgi:hypothetical protein